MAPFLDSMHRLIAAEELLRGTLARTSVYPREVVKAALEHNAAAVILAHNHPSRVAEPRRADDLLTTVPKQGLALIDCRTLDPFVVGGTKITVLRNAGCCEPSSVWVRVPAGQCTITIRLPTTVLSGANEAAAWRGGGDRPQAANWAGAARQAFCRCLQVKVALRGYPWHPRPHADNGLEV